MLCLCIEAGEEGCGRGERWAVGTEDDWGNRAKEKCRKIKGKLEKEKVKVLKK